VPRWMLSYELCVVNCRRSDTLIGVCIFWVELWWRRTAEEFCLCLYELFKGFGSIKLSTVAVRILFVNFNVKNRWRFFQGYQGDIQFPTGQSSWTTVFYLVCQQNIVRVMQEKFIVDKFKFETFSGHAILWTFRIC
jgi:hypothetical protein